MSAVSVLLSIEIFSVSNPNPRYAESDDEDDVDYSQENPDLFLQVLYEGLAAEVSERFM